MFCFGWTACQDCPEGRIKNGRASAFGLSSYSSLNDSLKTKRWISRLCPHEFPFRPAPKGFSFLIAVTTCKYAFSPADEFSFLQTIVDGKTIGGVTFLITMLSCGTSLICSGNIATPKPDRTAWIRA